jgi:5-methylcytosine-specific restriction protein A
VGYGERYCQDCLPIAKQEEAKYNQERDQTEERHFIHSTQWRAISNAKLARDPLCEQCLARGNDVAAVLVHHRDGNELNNLNENHESLCQFHHEEIHGPERWRN